MAKKIGILTYFWSPNPGTFLQALSTQRALERRFPEHRVEVINLRHRRIYFRPNRLDLKPSHFIAHFQRHFAYSRRRRKHLRLSPNGLVTANYDEAAAFIEAQHYDLIVVGADTVFQLLDAYSANGQPPIYWLPPALKCRKVALAASAAALTFDKLDEGLRQRLAESIHAFDLVAIRDDLTYSLMEDLGLKGSPRLRRVADPTFTYDIDTAPADNLVRRLRMDTSRPTICVSLPSRPDADAIVDHYKAADYQIVSFDQERSADYWLYNIEPFAWAGLHRYFRLEVTDRFHGSVFSLRNGTPLVGLEVDRQFYTKHGQSKKYSLLRQFGLEKTNHGNLDRTRDIGDVIRMCDRVMATFDREAALRRAEELRQEYLRMLDTVAELL
ncbi:MAG: polysaccharide pyruvyl transferase family protein [Planctomycetota bacterium]|nr:polysaccharide pyruvyl transferase family protein [Planctomycetota bacterium]